MLHTVRVTAVTAAIFGAGMIAATGFLAGHQSATSSALPTARAASATTSASLAAYNQDASAGAGSSSVSFGADASGAGPGMFGLHRGQSLKVTAVSGSTITALSPNAQSETITVTSATTYDEGGASKTLTDIQVGTFISVRGSGATAGALTATAVEIVLPQVHGVVTAVSGTTLTLTSLDASSQIIHVDGATFKKAGQSATAADMQVGSLISAQGTMNTDGSLQASSITIQLPHLGGAVKSVSPNGSGNTIVVSGAYGDTYTINTSSSTTFTQFSFDQTTGKPTSNTVTVAAVVAGANIQAEGSLSTDGKTLTALTVVVEPKAGQFGGRHRMGMPGGNGAGLSFGNGQGTFGTRQRAGGFQAPAENSGTTTSSTTSL